MTLIEYKTEKFKGFFFLNFTTIAVIDFFLLKINNGVAQNSYPWDVYALMLLITCIIILAQYPILHLNKSWIYKSFVFYISMIIFLFLFGLIVAIKWKDIDDNFSDYIKGGLFMIIYGQIFGGLLVFPIILFMNWRSE